MTINPKAAIPAGEFKAKCLQLMDEVHDSKKPLIITKRGKPIAKLIPINDEKKQSSYGCMKGSVKILADLTQPIGESWEADHD